MLDMHVDECDVTFNFGLSDTGHFTGSDLAPWLSFSGYGCARLSLSVPLSSYVYFKV